MAGNASDTSKFTSLTYSSKYDSSLTSVFFYLRRVSLSSHSLLEFTATRTLL